jgi:hypothetical protein
MTTGIDYGVTMDGNAYRSYVLAVSNVMHDNTMGSCYWPGLRNGDSYSMTKLATGSPLTLTGKQRVGPRSSTLGVARAVIAKPPDLVPTADILERDTGFEPATPSLGSSCSTN